ncbi:AraC family transcriptional regulator [Plantactinospora endophytica]|uniref:AraC family transcriptional regulator n=1 Tax=Plantactinospora endophytica TaxID=673535 RepID=A0ABQ4E0B0_9ACTN|nr:AraC family transcriptional regulator [Plantactinospora endophytica]GIG88159.1 AraC family transcriptional regulator [Plantactinospora endophytica]
MDVLSDAITAMRTGMPHSSRTVKRAPWGLRFAASDGAGFHVVLQGSCWLTPPGGQQPIGLAPGDVVFLAHGRGHGLADDPATPLVDVVPGPHGSWVLGEDVAAGSGPTTVLLCGAYRLNRARAHPLLTGLPEVVHLPARIGVHPELRAAVDLLGGELARPGPGSDAVLPALLDTLLLFIVRAWLRGDAEHAVTGWAAALGDPAIAEALHAIHDDPARPWTVRELGARAGLSRAAFARRFSTVVGQPPLAYLTWWRMTVAGRLLSSGADTPLRLVAQRSGYSSEFAFAKAFKREFGTSPGRYRNSSTSGGTGLGGVGDGR